jgi:hypothetical protein
MILNHLAQHVYFHNDVFQNLLVRAQYRPHLRQAIVDTCFGSSNPAALFAPHTLWDIFGF